MTTIKRSTKRGAQMLANAKHYEGYSLRDVYGSYSSAKKTAWFECLDMCDTESGSNFRIISHNTFGFSVAWDVAGGVRIETPKNSYLITY